MEDHLVELLAKVTPEVALEVRQLLEMGSIAFLPSPVKFEKARTWFGPDIKWVTAPDFDPRICPSRTSCCCSTRDS
jgi:hypothetical protein